MVEAQLEAMASLHNPLVHQGAVARGLVAHAPTQGKVRAPRRVIPPAEKRWLFIRLGRKL